VKRALFATAALVAAVAVLVVASLPPRPAAVDGSGVDPDLTRRIVPGAYHVHTTRSDGAEGKAAIAAAAARAGLTFVIFTDHGDGTSAPDPPAYLDGVLCLDGVEISTNGGHYVALGLPAAPYPLGGEAAAVVEDVARLGGFGIAAHVDSPKPELAWADWRAPIDGVEWLNADSQWRDETTVRLTRTLLGYFVRPAAAMATLFDRPSATLDRWAELSRTRRVVALAGLDAHGGVRRRLEGRSRFAAGPSYEASFRTLSTRVVLERPLSGDAVVDARALLGAVKQGRVYSAVDALAGPALLDPAAPPTSWRLPHGARVAAMGAPGAAGWYEIHLEDAPGAPPVPWVLTNPVTAPAPQPAPPLEPLAAGDAIAPEWRIEKDPTSSGSLSFLPDGAVSVSYALGNGDGASQFVALAGDLAEGEAAEQIVFAAEAERPMRVSVQLRFPPADRRWVKSVYLDGRPRTVVVPVEEMVAAERDGAPIPNAATARSILVVVDLTNAARGARGAFTLRGVRLARRPG
jgi:hypothetical protein